MASIGRIEGEITLKTDQFNNAITQVNTQTGALAQQTTGLNTAMANAATSLYILREGYGLADGVYQRFVSTTVNAVNQIENFSRVTGISFEQSGKWREVTEKLGVDINALQMGMRFLTQAQNEALTPTSNAAKAFNQLGISIKDTNGKLKDTNSLSLEVFSALQKIPDASTRNALAMDIFGRSYTNLNKLFSENIDLTKTLNEMDAPFSDADKKAIDDYAQAMRDLNQATDELSRTLGKQLVPALSETTKELTDLLKGKLYYEDLGPIGKLISDSLGLNIEKRAISKAPTITGVPGVEPISGLTTKELAAQIRAGTGTETEQKTSKVQWARQAYKDTFGQYPAQMTPELAEKAWLNGGFANLSYTATEVNAITGTSSNALPTPAQTFNNNFAELQQQALGKGMWVNNPDGTQFYIDEHGNVAGSVGGAVKEGTAGLVPTGEGTPYYAAMEGWRNDPDAFISIMPDGSIVPGYKPGFGQAVPVWTGQKSAAPAELRAQYRFATGGIITQPTVAMMGESGAEAVVPLTGNGGFGAGNVVVQISIDGNQVGEAIIDKLSLLGVKMA